MLNNVTSTSVLYVQRDGLASIFSTNLENQGESSTVAATISTPMDGLSASASTMEFLSLPWSAELLPMTLQHVVLRTVLPLRVPEHRTPQKLMQSFGWYCKFHDVNYPQPETGNRFYNSCLPKY